MSMSVSPTGNNPVQQAMATATRQQAPQATAGTDADGDHDGSGAAKVAAQPAAGSTVTVYA